MEEERHRHGNGDETEDDDEASEDGKLSHRRNLGREGLKIIKTT